MHRIKALFLASTLLAASAATARADVNVVTSIKPVHSLVAAVMAGVAEPELIVDGASSPHSFALKPSQARMLEQADVVFWVGRELEVFLEKPLKTVGAGAKSVELIDSHDLVRLAFREGGPFEKHAHDDGDDHDDHGHENGHGRDHADKAEKDDGHNHGTAAKAGHDHDQGHDNDDEHGVVDAHVWLDPVNAKAFIHEIGEALVEVDPKNADRYKANVEKVAAKLDALVAEIDAELKPVKGRGYVVFHDAYQYFENRFAMTAAGSITVSPEVMPGAERVSEIRARVRELGAACVFAEPQFEPRLVATVTEGTQSRSGVLDPLGAGIENGPDLYYQLIRNLAGSMKSCLTQAS